MSGRTPDEAWAREMLTHVLADCSREDWLRIAAALKAGLGDSGWTVFNNWSQTAPDRYDAADCRRDWESLSPDGEVTWGTLVYHARAGGWQPPPDTALTAQWTIRETDGTPVAIHYRTTLLNASKRFWWGLPDGSKGLGGRKARTLPLYGAELLADSAAPAICIVEGEKAADALRRAEPSVLVLGTVTGAASSPAPEVLKPVAASGLPVLLWPDADPDGAGTRHMHRVASRLIEAGGEAPSIIEWPGAPPKGDAADWAVARKPSFEELVAAATVIKPKRKRRTRSLAKAPTSHTDGLPVIVAVPGERARWTREAVAALVAVGPQNDRESLYASARAVYETGDNAGDLLFLREAPPPKPDSSVQTPEGTLLFAPATLVAVQSLIDTAVRWYVVRRTRGGEEEEVPGEIRKGDVELVIERYRHDCLDHKRPRLRVLRGIVDAPTLRADGSLLAASGYDDTSGLYADFDPSARPTMPERPTRTDARAALVKLYDLVEETPFAAPMHRAVWVAALLTVVARNFAAGNVPLFAFSANVPGAGKGTLVDLIAEIATGRGATKWAPVSAARTGDIEAEERKRLMAVALSGNRLLCIDNIKPGEPLGTPALEAALTAGEDEQIGAIADRVLGESRQTEAPWQCVVMATGNNLSVVGDMGRRAVLCRLESDLPDPETRQFKRYPKLLQHTRNNRTELLMAALTVLLAHKHAVDAGEPDVLLPRINSFGGWSDRIRSAVWWTDPEGCDPWDGNRELKATAQAEQAEAQAFFAAWHTVFGSREVPVRTLELFCREDGSDYNQALADAVAELGVAAPHGKAALNVRSVGMWLTAHADRPGPYVLHKGEAARKWFVEKTTVQEDVSRLGDFVGRIQRSQGEVMTVVEVWDAWRKYNEVSDTATKVGGIDQARLDAALRCYVPEFPDSVDGRWNGWWLLPEGELETILSNVRAMHFILSTYTRNLEADDAVIDRTMRSELSEPYDDMLAQRLSYCSQNARDEAATMLDGAVTELRPSAGLFNSSDSPAVHLLASQVAKLVEEGRDLEQWGFLQLLLLLSVTMARLMAFDWRLLMNDPEGSDTDERLMCILSVRLIMNQARWRRPDLHDPLSPLLDEIKEASSDRQRWPVDGP